MKRAHFILPEIAIVHPISSMQPPSTLTLKEEKRAIEEREKALLVSSSPCLRVLLTIPQSTSDASPRTRTLSGLPPVPPKRVMSISHHRSHDGGEEASFRLWQILQNSKQR